MQTRCDHGKSCDPRQWNASQNIAMATAYVGTVDLSMPVAWYKSHESFKNNRDSRPLQRALLDLRMKTTIPCRLEFPKRTGILRIDDHVTDLTRPSKP